METTDKTVTLSSDHMDDEIPFIGAYRELCLLDGNINYDADGISIDPTRVFVSEGLMATWLGKYADESWTMKIVSWGPKIDPELSGLDVRLKRNWVMQEID